MAPNTRGNLSPAYPTPAQPGKTERQQHQVGRVPLAWIKLQDKADKDHATLHNLPPPAPLAPQGRRMT